jgi:hypothetical protein
MVEFCDSDHASQKIHRHMSALLLGSPLFLSLKVITTKLPVSLIHSPSRDCSSSCYLLLYRLRNRFITIYEKWSRKCWTRNCSVWTHYIFILSILHCMNQEVILFSVTMTTTFIRKLTFALESVDLSWGIRKTVFGETYLRDDQRDERSHTSCPCLSVSVFLCHNEIQFTSKNGRKSDGKPASLMHLDRKRRWKWYSPLSRISPKKMKSSIKLSSLSLFST